MAAEADTTATSFVVTVYNKLPFLRHVLDAVAAECGDVGGEIVIVDDGSTDGSGAFLDRFEVGRENVRLIRQVNQGAHAAVNTGIGAATMPHIRLIDADDIPVLGSTRLMIETLCTSGAQFLAGDKELYEIASLDPAQLRPVDRAQPARFDIMADPIHASIRNNEIVPSMTLMTRAVARSVLPLPEISRIGHDFLIVVRAARVTSIVKLRVTVCYFAAVAHNRVSSSVSGMYYHTAMICREHMDGPFAWAAKDRRFAVRRNAGRALLYARRHLPFNPRRWLGLFAVRLLGYLPLYGLFPSALDYVAETYRPAPGRR